MATNNQAIDLHDGTYKAQMPSKPKKMTATRLSKVLNLNHWATPFQAWCEIMRVAEPPFEDNKYTVAGKAIEPKLIEFCRSQVSPYIVAPEDYYDSMQWRWDFFPDNPIVGGMWDALAFDRDGVTEHDSDVPMAIIECKTSSRPQDWENGVPEHYKVQGILYAYLSGCEDVYFPVAFLKAEDYENPEAFECNEENTRLFHVNVNDRIGEFDNIVEAVKYAEDWWEKHVVNGVSPCYNDTKDKEYLSIVRDCSIEELNTGDDDDFNALCSKMYEIDEMIAAYESDEGYKRLKEMRKELNKQIQAMVKPKLVELDGKDSVSNDMYTFKVSPTRKVNYDAMEKDGVTDLYVTTTMTIRTTRKEKN